MTFATTKERWHDATGTGALNGPSGSQPKSRDSFSAMWQGWCRPSDRHGPTTAPTTTAAHQPGQPPLPLRATRFSLAKPPTSAAGEGKDQTGPKSQVSSSEYDNLGRITKITQNHGSTPTEVTETAYAAGGQVKTLTAKNATHRRPNHHVCLWHSVGWNWARQFQNRHERSASPAPLIPTVGWSATNTTGKVSRFK